MANKEYDGFPKVLSKDGAPNRVANTPTDEVNLAARGYKVVETNDSSDVGNGPSKVVAKPTAPAGSSTVKPTDPPKN